jgi:hypothetical protein
VTTLAVLQPGYLPWLGFFDQMQRADAFVFFDDVQFDKQGWRNRNRLKSPQGPVWLTVPILHKGRTGQNINQVEINSAVDWAGSHIRTIRQLYARAPFIDLYLPELEETLMREWHYLVDLDLELIGLFCQWLGLDRPTYRASELGIGGDRTTRLLNLCRHFKADTYLSGDAARDYLDEDLFKESSIRVEWQDYAHPTYPQLHGDFISHLSILDLILNVGKSSLDTLSLRHEHKNVP